MFTISAKTILRSCNSFLSRMFQSGCGLAAVPAINGFRAFSEHDRGVPGDSSRRLCSVRASASPAAQTRQHAAWREPVGCRHVSQDGRGPSICSPVIKSRLCFPALSTLYLSACIMPSITRRDFSLLCKPLIVMMAAHSKAWFTGLSIILSLISEKVRFE